MHTATYKPQGCKLIRIKAKGDKTITEIQILGDFFVHPEEALKHIENRLRGLNPHNTAALIATIRQTQKKENITLVGITPEGIAETIEKAYALENHTL